ncbi:MAG: hypothetical protein Q7V05_06500 [Methanoregula sp.]|nr:hypothetical protein [Methanoregula sp.]
MNTCAIIPEKDPSLTLIAFQLVSVLGAGVFLFTSRFYPFALVPAILLLGMAVFLAGYSRYRLFSILLIGIFTALILSLRFDYLPWGDPWYEYGMIQRILAFQSLDPSVYPAQLPVMHVIVATLSLFSGINPLDLQKCIIPLLSVIGLYAVYRFTKDISSSTETAFFAGLLLLCGTPYLHWTTQGVRETLGIALFVLALYVSFTAIQSHKKGYLFVSLLLTGGLVLTHDLSSIMFLLVWIAVSLTFLYLMCDMNRIRTTALFSLLIASTAVIFIVAWGWRSSTYGYSQFSSLVNTVFHSEYGIPLFILSLIVLYLLPLKIPDKILVLRSIVTKILIRKNIIYAVFITGTVVSSGVVLHFILGKSSFVLSYPLPMFFNGLCMILLSLIGLYYFLEIDRLHVLAWIAALALILVLSMSNLVPFVDPLRFMEFLYIPLAIIAAFGVSFIAGHLRLSKILPLVLAVFVIISVATSFPPVVLLGNSFEPGHPLFDTRSWVIQHNASEISAISWLDNSYASGIIETDSYVRYAVIGIIRTDALTIQSEYTFVKEGGYPQSSDTSAEQHYLLILSRFTDYMEFGAQWLKEKKPLDREALTRINRDCNVLYDNGNAVIYSFSTH